MNALLAFSAPIPHQLAAAKPLLTAHDVQNVYATLHFVVPIDDAARGLDKLTVTPPVKFLGFRATVRVCFELIHMLENSPNELFCRRRIFKCYVICKSIQVCQRGVRPNYFRHRAILAMA